MKDSSKQKTFVLSPEVEKEWWELLKVGNKPTLHKIYNTFSDGMFGYGMTIIADRDFIKDCIQDVFVDIWKYKSNLSSTNNIKLYLHKALRNKIYRLSAKERKNKILAKENFEVMAVPSQEDVLIDEQKSKGLQKKMTNCMDKLPPRQREVIRHLFFENHSYEEISIMMSINIRSVYTLAWKALASLRKAFS